MNVNRIARTGMIISLILFLSFSAGASYADATIQISPGTTERVSVATNGTEGNADSGWGQFEDYYQQEISGNGRFVAFMSEATNIVEGDANGVADIFVHDRESGATTLVSVASNGTLGNGKSVVPSISGDGRYIVFESVATNLVTGDTNGETDVFIHDQVTGETSRVSVSSDEVQGNGWSYSSSISADGRYVAFASFSSNLVNADNNGMGDIFVRDQILGVTERVSVASDGAEANSYSDTPSISPDGRYVAFISIADNLVAGDTNMERDVFVHDRLTGETRRVSVASDGTQGNGMVDEPSISTDGNFVSFASVADNLVSSDTNATWDVFVHNLHSGETTRVSISSAGMEGNSWSSTSVISADGRYVAFISSANNLVYGDTNNWYDLFVHDRYTGVTTCASLTSTGSQAEHPSDVPSISMTGRFVSFTNYGSDLVPGDTNGFTDVFVRDRGELSSIYIPLIKR